MTATNEERRIKILEFVFERQKSKQNTTKNDVIEHMRNEKLSSRQTTHNLLKELIKERKLNVQEINSQIHFLTVTKNWDKIQEELLKSQLEKALKQFPDVNKVTMIKGKPSPESPKVSYSIGIKLEKRKQKKVKH